MTETFVKERKHAETGKMQPVGIDDAAAVLARFANGSLGTFESTRYARGHKALYTLRDQRREGLARLGPARPATALQYFDHGDRRQPPRLDAASSSPTAIIPTSASGGCPACIIGYEHTFTHQVADFLEGLKTGKPAAPTFRDALETNRICDAIIASGKSGGWVNL